MTYRISISLRALLLTLFVVTASMRLTAQNLLVNPGFENGTAGWATDCSIEINPETVYGGVNASNRVTEIDVERCFKQQVSVNAGAMYDFSFLAARRQGSTPATVGVTVTITGDQTGTAYINLSHTYTNTTWAYTTESYVFMMPIGTADNSVTIRFTNYLTTGTYGTLIDNVNFSVDPQSSVLPVKLTAFSGSVSNHAALLNWSTSEVTTTSDKFVIERSSASGKFDSIAMVSGGGRTFSFTNNEMTPGRNLYRLRMMNANGAIYSRVVSLDNAAPVSALQLYPNPAVSAINLRMNANAADRAAIKIFDRMGVLRSSKQVALISGENLIALDVSSFPTGQYFVQIGAETKQFCKQ